MKSTAFSQQEPGDVYLYRTLRFRLATKTLLVMKFMLLFFTLAFCAMASDGASQSITFTAKDASPQEVMTAVKRQANVVFLYKKEILKDARKINVTATNMPVSQFLEIAFHNQPFDWSIRDHTVVLKRKEETAAPSRIDSIPQNIAIRGRLVDETGKPVIGASISVKGVPKRTFSDNNGEFELNDLDGKAILVITAVNIETQEVPVNNKTRINVIAKTKVTAMDEVMVMVNTGYQALPKERATGSFGVVTARQLEKTPTVSVLERLQGLVPGVDITTKTASGKSRNGAVTIRGLSTIVSQYSKNAQISTEPLVVIDGFPAAVSISQGALDFLNPADIEQITFLKDAAAVSIWGIQAANGVIVIDTKKGKSNSKPTFSFSATLGTSKRPRADYGKMLSVPEYIEVEKELIEKNVLFDPVTSSGRPVNGSQAQNIIFAFKRGEITEAQMNQQLDDLGKIDNSKQISEYLLQPPTTQQYNLSVSGGGTNNSYFVSGYFYTEDRAYKSNTNKGYSLRASNVAKFLDGRIQVTSDLSFGNTRDKVNGAAVRAMSIADGGLRVYDQLVDDKGNPKYYDVLVTSPVARSLESKGYLPFRYSPVDELNYSNTISTSHNLNFNLAVNASITSWLGLNLSGNFGRVFSESEQYLEPDSYDARMLVNKGTSVNSTGARIYGVPIGGKLTSTDGTVRTYSGRAQLAVNKTWQGRHQLMMIAGAEIRERVNKSDGEIRYGYDREINSFRSVNPGYVYTDMYGSNQSIGATSMPVVQRTSRSLSYYGNASYTFDRKYVVSGSARLDDNNLLGVERHKRAVPLWSTGLKWNINEETFLRSVKWINQLGARATYGFSGNAPQGYAPVIVIDLLGSNFYTGYPYARIYTPAVQNLGWETTRMINYGIDYSLFGNRVFGSFEYYTKRTKDILWSMPINATYGFSELLFNTASLYGKGVDMIVSVVPVRNRNIKWTSSVNLSYNTNVIKDSRFERPTLSFDQETLYNGYPADYLFSYSWAGLDKTGQSLINDPKKPGTVYTVMDYPFQDIRVYSGRTKSPWFGGFNNSLQYKQWELGVQMLYNFGGVFRKPSLTSIGFSNNTLIGRIGDLGERWRQPGDEAKTNVPGLIFGAGANYYASVGRYTDADYLIRSRSVIRLQQISLGYNVPPKFLVKTGIQSLNLSASCRNIGKIWAANKEGLDPDYTYTTGESYQLAPVPAFTFRASINF